MMSHLPRTSRGTARRSRHLIVVAVVAVLVGGLFVVSRADTKRSAMPVVAGVQQNPSTVHTMHDPMTVAVDDATILARLFQMAASQARNTVATITTDAFRPTFAAAIEHELVPLQQQAAALPGKTIFRQSVLATQRVNVTANAASVSVWMLIVVGQAGQQANPAASFATVTVDLVVEHGEWKLNHVAQQAGPTPLLSGQPDLIDSFDQRLLNFADWRN